MRKSLVLWDGKVLEKPMHVVINSTALSGRMECSAQPPFEEQ